MAAGELLLRAKEALLEARELRQQRTRLLEEKAELVAATQSAVEEFRKMPRISFLSAFPELPETRKHPPRVPSQNAPSV